MSQEVLPVGQLVLLAAVPVAAQERDDRAIVGCPPPGI